MKEIDERLMKALKRSPPSGAAAISSRAPPHTAGSVASGEPTPD
jgi:hypothetical protein